MSDQKPKYDSRGGKPSANQQPRLITRGGLPTTNQRSISRGGIPPTNQQPNCVTRGGFPPTNQQPISVTRGGFPASNQQPMTAAWGGFVTINKQPISVTRGRFPGSVTLSASGNQQPNYDNRGNEMYQPQLIYYRQGLLASTNQQPIYVIPWGMPMPPTNPQPMYMPPEGNRFDIPNLWKPNYFMVAPFSDVEDDEDDFIPKSRL